MSNPAREDEDDAMYTTPGTRAQGKKPLRRKIILDDDHDDPPIVNAVTAPDVAEDAPDQTERAALVDDDDAEDYSEEDDEEDDMELSEEVTEEDAYDKQDDERIFIAPIVPVAVLSGSLTPEFIESVKTNIANTYSAYINTHRKNYIKMINLIRNHFHIPSDDLTNAKLNRLVQGLKIAPVNTGEKQTKCYICSYLHKYHATKFGSKKKVRREIKNTVDMIKHIMESHPKLFNDKVKDLSSELFKVSTAKQTTLSNYFKQITPAQYQVQNKREFEAVKKLNSLIQSTGGASSSTSSAAGSAAGISNTRKRKLKNILLEPVVSDESTVVNPTYEPTILDLSTPLNRVQEYTPTSKNLSVSKPESRLKQQGHISGQGVLKLGPKNESANKRRRTAASTSQVRQQQASKAQKEKKLIITTEQAQKMLDDFLASGEYEAEDIPSYANPTVQDPIMTLFLSSQPPLIPQQQQPMFNQQQLPLLTNPDQFMIQHFNQQQLQQQLSQQVTQQAIQDQLIQEQLLAYQLASLQNSTNIPSVEEVIPEEFESHLDDPTYPAAIFITTPTPDAPDEVKLEYLKELAYSVDDSFVSALNYLANNRQLIGLYPGNEMINSLYRYMVTMQTNSSDANLALINQLISEEWNRQPANNIQLPLGSTPTRDDPVDTDETSFGSLPFDDHVAD